jgi:site-specific DNA recombinase
VQKRRVPEAEWMRQPMPHLAIVDREVFEAAQMRRGKRCQVRLSDRRRPRHMLSGVVRCGACGGNMIAASDRRLTCSAHINKGTCDNRRTIKVEEVETRVLEALQLYLLERHVVEAVVEAYRLERERLAAERAKAVREVERELASIERQIARIIDYIATTDLDQRRTQFDRSEAQGIARATG